MHVLPLSPYAVSKLAGEGFCRSFAGVYGLDCVALRYFNVFGPRQDPTSQYSAVIPNFITAALAGRAPVVYGDGEQSRDFTYVANVVEANVMALEGSDLAGRVYNVACGERISLNHLLAEIGSLLGVEITPEYLEGRAGDVPHSLADIGAAERDLGYRPTVLLREGLRRTIAALAPAGGELAADPIG
jgi:nucleoside-diphosphate-sugar epimerase